MSILSAHHGSAAAASRMRKRHMAQMRLKAYGIIALVLAGLALVALLWSVVGKAALVVTESYITLPVEITESEVDPDNLRAANWNGLRQDALRAAFPDVSGRTARRALGELTSAGSAFELRDRVEANPALIGQTIEFPFLASDDVDLYLKGVFGLPEPVEHGGSLTVTVDGDEAELASSADDFAIILPAVHARLNADAAQLRVQAARQQNGIDVVGEELAAATDEETRAGLQDRIDTYTATRDQLLGRAEALERSAENPDGLQELTTSDSSLMVRIGAGWVKVTEVSASRARGEVIVPLPAAASEGEVPAADWRLLVNDTPEITRRVDDAQGAWLQSLDERGAVAQVFNWRFLTTGNSREAELAGIWGAAVGSFWTMLVTFCIAFPIGVLSAVYLEEFAPKNRITDFIEVNINNLAAVPSIVFGLLGLAVFLNVFGIPRSAPLAGGFVLALMTLPTIIIAARAAIRAVPPSIRDAALGLGASKLQTSFHHVIPLGMPGILTGTIIGMAQALGETAPLIMIGMVAFITGVPGGVTDPATALPVQVYLWSDFPERAFEAKTAAAICVLLIFLVIMNALAVFLRKRFERRW
ncbi:phosphate ABC transporter permease PstA [Oceanicella sp. SM1341]|uniref:phosphate ABC transporter permease PstA n=1 Tax=Oceanicella sp. SM1341 TaxID=1548889 RepID=UPI001E51DE7C|nr:phosphate ABC transporter permease PstA [Oceanicella sp. SM1341]